MSDDNVKAVDDTKVIELWREAGLPEYFLGNGGTNIKLVQFAVLCVKAFQEKTYLTPADTVEALKQINGIAKAIAEDNFATDADIRQWAEDIQELSQGYLTQPQDQSERIKGTGNKYTVPSLRRTVDEDGNKVVIMSERSYEMMAECLEVFSEQPDQSEVIRDLAGALKNMLPSVTGFQESMNWRVYHSNRKDAEICLEKHAELLKEAEERI